jgi:hypothetical protein
MHRGARILARRRRSLGREAGPGRHTGCGGCDGPYVALTADRACVTPRRKPAVCRCVGLTGTSGSPLAKVVDNDGRLFSTEFVGVYMQSWGGAPPRYAHPSENSHGTKRDDKTDRRRWGTKSSNPFPSSGESGLARSRCPWCGLRVRAGATAGARGASSCDSQTRSAPAAACKDDSLRPPVFEIRSSTSGINSLVVCLDRSPVMAFPEAPS